MVVKKRMSSPPTVALPLDFGGDSSSVTASTRVLPLHRISSSTSSGSDKTPLQAKISPTCSDSEDSHSSKSSRGRCSSSGSSGLPLWTANPQSPLDDSYVQQQRNRLQQQQQAQQVQHLSISYNSSHSDPSLPTYHQHQHYHNQTVYKPYQTGKRGFSASLFLVGFAIVGLAAIVTSRATVTNAVDQVAQLEFRRLSIDEQLSKAQQDMHILKREITAMDQLIYDSQHNHHLSSSSQKHSNSKTSTSDVRERALDEMNKLSEKLQQEGKLAESLKAQVQAMSREHVEQKYGVGKTFQIEVELVFPDHKLGPTTFVIELASLEVMPHSVHVFLEMVSTGLLDGCSFILNALHVLKAAPLPYDGSSAADKAREFTRLGLESVAYKEYSSAFPHKQYTVGFTADGSPGFYINTEDNSEIHSGDPCFGRIIKGFDAVRRLEAAPTRNGIWFEKRIGIKRATIL